MKTVAEMWEHFAKHVVPPDAHPMQVREMHDTFYDALFLWLQELRDLGDKPKEEWTKWFAVWRKELQEHAVLIQAEGRAEREME